MASPLLALRHVSKTYPGVRALRDIAFDLKAGEVHALLGENGAGKSTLIKIITGVVLGDASSEIEVASERVMHPSPRVMQCLGIAAVYQNPTLFNELTVAENLRMGEDGVFISWRERRKVAGELLSRIGATLDLDAPVGTLRMAEKQLIEIARAISRQARVLILDEPTASLAHQDAERLLELVEALRTQGVGILYISHRLEEVLRIADRITVLRDGAHVGTYEKQEVDRSRLIHLMAGRDLAELFPKTAVPIGKVVLEMLDLSCATSGVSHISLSLRAGEILGLAGLVGAGRTELARILFGLTPATSGQILIDGKVATIQSVPEAIAHRIAYVPEDRKEHGVIEDLPINENISLPSLRRLNGAWLAETKEDALASSFTHQLAVKATSIHVQTRTLSGGNQQKVALSRWLATSPRILILDEPTQGIDVGAKAEIHRLMGQLAQQGMAILLISSELPELLGMADRLAVMRRGRLAGVLSAKDATREAVLKLAMEDAG